VIDETTSFCKIRYLFPQKADALAALVPLQAAMDCAWICGESARRRSTRQLVSRIADRPWAL